MKFILFLFIAYSFFFFLARKYQNPYKLYYLLGRKGAGKSSFMAREMIKYLKKGWYVYTDMPGVPGRKIEVKKRQISEKKPAKKS